MPRIAELLQAAIEQLQDRNFQVAVQILDEALDLEADNAMTYHLLGVALMQSGQSPAAIDAFRQALQLAPESIDPLLPLAVCLRTVGRMSEALIVYQRIAALCPENADAQNDLGATLQAMGDLEAAALAYQRAIDIRPDMLAALNNRGLVCMAMGQPKAAFECHRRAVELSPDSAESHQNLANACQALGRLEAAIDHYQTAIRLHPTLRQAHHNLGVAYHRLKEFDAAVAAYRQAIALDPTHAETFKNLGSTYQAQWKIDEAIQAYDRALAIKPNYAEALDYLIELRRGVCAWDQLDELSVRLGRLIDQTAGSGDSIVLRPFPNFAVFPPLTAEQQSWTSRQWAKRIQNNVRFLPKLNAIQRPKRPASSRLRIGYLSDDFRAHAVAYLVPELFEEHDRTRFEVFAYSTSPDDGSAIRQRIAVGVDRFRDVQSMSFYDASRCIARDEIDILIDLQGYTGQSKTEIVALRPAPIQVNYLGFAGTMGADFIDYIVVDDFVVPSDQQPCFSERLVHLPGCFMVNDSRREIASKTISRREAGLPDDGLVFCAFSTSYKITPKMFDVWCRLLRTIDKAVLWLRSDNALARFNLQQEAVRRGVALERLVFAPTLSMPDHLARHRLADLFLDTFPYNQHSSASDAIRMGLPLLTLAGSTFASRVAGSLLRAVGLADWIAGDFDEYEAMALRFARDPDLRTHLRQRLREGIERSSLVKGRVFARHMESAYLEMWRIYESDALPRPIEILDLGNRLAPRVELQTDTLPPNLAND